jgi:hypothetical protein
MQFGDGYYRKLTVLYGSESRTLGKVEKRRIEAAQIISLRPLDVPTRTDHVRNEVIRQLEDDNMIHEIRQCSQKWEEKENM